MKNIFFLIKKDFTLFKADKVAVGLTFVVPAVLIFLFGSIFGGSGGSVAGIPIIYLDQSGIPVGRKIGAVLDTSKAFQILKSYTDENGKQHTFDTLSALTYVKTGKATAALIIPPQSDTSSAALTLQLLYDPKNEMEMSIVEGLLQQTVMSQMPQLFGSYSRKQIDKLNGKGEGNKFNKELSETIGKFFNTNPDSVLEFMNAEPDTTTGTAGSGTSGAGNFFSNVIRFEREQVAGKDINNPGATRSVGGWAMMFLLFTISAASLSLLEEQKGGTMVRLLSAPLSRIEIMIAKYIYNTLLGIIQLCVLFLFGVLFFKIDIFTNFFNLLLIIIFSAYAATSFGIALASFSRTQAQANGLSTFLILVMSSIGGAWFPVFILPAFIQIASKGTIVYWAIDGFLKVLWRNCTVAELTPNLLVLLLIGTVINSFSFYRFKQGKVI